MVEQEIIVKQIRNDDDTLNMMIMGKLVRCKDCKYWKTAEGVNLSKRVKFCTYHIGYQYARHDEDFCSRGERKDGEQHGTK